MPYSLRRDLNHYNSFSLVVFFFLHQSMMISPSILTFEKHYIQHATRLLTRNFPLTPANMRCVDGGYVISQGQPIRARAYYFGSARKIKICKARLKAAKRRHFNRKSAFIQQERALQTEENVEIRSQLLKKEREVAEQKAFALISSHYS